MKVIFGKLFNKEFQNYPLEDKRKIRLFVIHLREKGFTGLEGRNKSSDEVPTDDPQWREKVAYAQQHNLWHYHIGIPNYQITDRGDKVSEYILHYIRGENTVKIVDFNRHPPFRLPRSDYLH